MNLIERLSEITLYGAAVFLTVVLIRAAFRRRLSPALCYALWFLVLLRLVVPLTIESGFHPIRLPANAPIPAETVNGAEQGATITTANGVKALVAGGAPTQAEGGTNAPEYEPAKPKNSVRRRLDATQILTLVWLCGAGVVFLFEIAMRVQLTSRIRKTVRKPRRETLALYQGVKDKLGVKGRVPLSLLDGISSPALTASLFPLVVLPTEMEDVCTDAELTLAFTHELTHYRRLDHLVCLLVSLLRAVYWFNPVVWLLASPLRTDMEAACDARVVRHMNAAERLSYANLLLELGRGTDFFAFPQKRREVL